MPKYKVTITDSALSYSKDITIDAKDKEEAFNLVLAQYKEAAEYVYVKHIKLICPNRGGD